MGSGTTLGKLGKAESAAWKEGLDGPPGQLLARRVKSVLLTVPSLLKSPVVKFAEVDCQFAERMARSAEVSEPSRLASPRIAYLTRASLVEKY